MVSFWWVLIAFIGGGWAGILVMALMQMACGFSKRFAHATDLNALSW